MLAVFQQHLSVNYSVVHAVGLLAQAHQPTGEVVHLVRLFRADGVRVEHHYVGGEAGAQQAAVVQSEERSLHEAELPHRFLQRERALLAYPLAEDDRAVAVARLENDVRACVREADDGVGAGDEPTHHAAVRAGLAVLHAGPEVLVQHEVEETVNDILALGLRHLRDAHALVCAVALLERAGDEYSLPRDGQRAGRQALAVHGLGAELVAHRGVAEGGGFLLDRAEHHVAPGGHPVEYLGVAHGEALRLGAGVDDGVHLLPFGDTALDDVQVALPPVRLAGVVDDLVVDDGALRVLAEFRGEAVAYLQRVRRAALHDASSHIAERGGQLVQLLDGRHDAGDGASEQVHVAAVAVEREAECALPDGIADELLHLFHLGGCGLGALERLIAHHPAAYGGVADERARVDAEALVEEVEVAAERRPLPRDAFLEALHGDRLDA